VGLEPTSRAHEAREESRSSTAHAVRGPRRRRSRASPGGSRAVRGARSGRLGSNQRSPVPETGGLPTPLQPEAMRPGRGPGGVREVDDRGIEPRFTAVSERRLPSRPVVDYMGRRQGIAPCSTDSQPAGSLQALRRSLAGRTRTPIARGRSAALIHLSYGEERSRRESNPPHPIDSRAACPRRVRELEVPRAGIEPALPV
jgi:hypothetical protein